MNRRLFLLALLLTALAGLPDRASAQCGPPLYVLDGTGDDLLGEVVSEAGDVNADGHPDFVVGAPEDRTVPGGWHAGSVRVYSGVDGTLLHHWLGDERASFLGASVDAAGDVDGDGYDDIVAGAPGWYNGASGLGLTYARVYSGRTGSALYTWVGGVCDVNPWGGVCDQFGDAVAGVGDVDGDGTPDLLVGIPYREVGTLQSAGQTYLYSGATGERLYTLTAPDPEAGGKFGTAVAGPGDLDGDGRPDLLVGAPGTDAGGQSWAGIAYAFSGPTGALLYTWSPLISNTRFGEVLDGAGDVDADGNPDVVIGSYGIGGPSIVRVYSGGTGDLIHAWQRWGGFGYAVSGAGDADFDGHDDILVGAWQEPVGSARHGAAYLYSGRTGAQLHAWYGENSQDRYGFAVAGPGDMNADGHVDVVVGAPDVGTEDGRLYAYSLACFTVAAAASLPAAFALAPPRPNPATTRTTLGYTLPEASRVRLAVYDVLGRAVAVLADGPREASAHDVTLDASVLPSGTYLVRLTAGDHVETRRLTLLR